LVLLINNFIAEIELNENLNHGCVDRLDGRFGI